MQFKSILMSLMVLFVLFSFVSFAYGEEVNVDRFDIRKSSDLPLDETEILEMVEKNTPAIDPKNFEIMKSSNATLASYGELPSKSGVDSYNWHLLLLQITGSVQNNTELEKYGYADGGSIIGYGARYTDGFVHVKVDKERSSLLTQNDLDTIYAIFEKHANEYGVKNLPLIIARDNQIEYTLAPSDAVRPIIGGLQAEGVVHNNSTGIGTIGYPVIGTNNSSSTKGYVTVSHFFHPNVTPVHNVPGSLYQPRFYNDSSRDSTNLTATGLINDCFSKVDALHVRYSSISSQLYVGDDPVLENYTYKIGSVTYNRTNDNKTKMMIYGSSSPSGELRRFGITTGNTGGYYVGFERNTTPGGGPKIIDTVYYMNGTVSQPGDSGGPIYMGMNVTISGQKDYQAFIVGITNGHHENETTGEMETVFAPQAEIDYYLHVRPYWSRTATLT